MVGISMKVSSSMECGQAMEERSNLIGTMLDTIKMADNMAKEQKSILMAQPMWVPGKTATNMVQVNSPTDSEQYSKENGWKTSSMVFGLMTSEIVINLICY